MNQKSIEQHFFNFVKTLELSNKKIAVGFSGGLDSCALLDLCVRFLPKNSFEAVYFAHGTNPLMTPGERAGEFCHERCQRYGVKFIEIELELNKGKTGWEAAGHKARKDYAFNNYDLFFLGHHLDDQVENYFIQTMRGAGSARHLKSEEQMLRPLLGIEKKDLKTYLEIKELNWVEDETNKNNDLTRNFWRNRMLPSLEEHYPDYRASVMQASQADENLLVLAKDLAQVDGLDSFIASDKLEYPNFMDTRRISNLIYFYCKSKSISASKPTIDEFVKQIQRPQKKITMELLGLNADVEKNNINKSLVINFSMNPQLANALKNKKNNKIN